MSSSRSENLITVGLKVLVGLLALFSLILWVPFSNWFIEIFSPNTKLFVLSALSIAASLLLFRWTESQSPKKLIVLMTVAVSLMISGITSILALTFTTIPPPLDTFGFDHDFHVGHHHVEARRVRIYNLSAGTGEILVREIKPLASGIRLVRKPIAVGDEVTGVNLRKVDEDSFSYQFLSDEIDYPVCKVQFRK